MSVLFKLIFLEKYTHLTKKIIFLYNTGPAAEFLAPDRELLRGEKPCHYLNRLSVHVLDEFYERREQIPPIGDHWQNEVCEVLYYLKFLIL